MFRMFYPKEYLNSTYDIDFKKMYDKGYRGVIFDIDNTLVMHGYPADAHAIAFFEKLREIGFSTCLVSNNKRPRVESFAVEVQSEFIFKANKPSTKGYQAAMDKMSTCKDNTLFVGDQLFTDVYGANRTGLYSILVKPIDPHEEIQIILKRYLERIVLFFYERRKKHGN